MIDIRKFWAEYRVWIIAIAVMLLCAFVMLKISGCVRKRAAEKEAIAQRRADSMATLAEYLGSKIYQDSIRMQQIEADNAILKASIESLSTQRKTESHAYIQTNSTVSSLPADKQFELFAKWLPDEVANR